MGNPICGGCGYQPDAVAVGSTWGIRAGSVLERGEPILLCERCTIRIARALWPELVGLVAPSVVDRDDMLAVVRVINETMMFFGYDQASASRWFASPVLGLGGRCPTDLVQHEAGRQAIMRLLGQLAHGVLP